MLKRTILILLLLIPFLSSSQSLDRWQVGLNVAPFYFGRYNENTYREKVGQNFPNGYFAGLTVEKNWNMNWGFKAGLEYSFQNYKEIDYIPVMSGSNVNSDFEFLKLPVMLQYSKPLGNTNSLFLVFNQGVQVSRLMNYHETRDDHLQTITYTSGKRYFYGKEQGISNEMDFEAYPEYVFGLVGGIGIKKLFSENFSYSLQGRYEFDLTNADKDRFYKPFTTHNYRIGLVLGLQYHIKNTSK